MRPVTFPPSSEMGATAGCEKRWDVIWLRVFFVVVVFNIYSFIYLAAPGLSCRVQDLLVAACGIL